MQYLMKTGGLQKHVIWNSILCQ